MTQLDVHPASAALDALRERPSLWVDGEWREPSGGDAIDVVDPATGSVVATVGCASASDVADAVAAAARAFAGWSSLPVGERLDALGRLARLVEQRADDLGDVLTTETGMPRTLTGAVQVPFGLGALGATLQAAAGYEWERRIGHSLVVREAAGVAACITPWNAPIALILQKLAPALVAGCTVVLKPSELAPLNAILLAELVDAAGLGRGVVNVVPGRGTVAGEALAAHPDVDVVSLTGSLRAGRRVAELAAPRAARVSLELGGKSASIALDDADLELAVAATVDQVMFNSGQACFAWSRLLVPAGRYEEAVEIAAGAATSMSVGDPWDPETRVGPVISAAARDRVLGMVSEAAAAGARVVTGGDGLDGRGFFVRPTVVADAPLGSRVVREEVFGPVVTIIPVDGDDAAVALCNDSSYGLHGAVWSADVSRAAAVARRMRTGRVDVNGAPFNMAAPFGGYKQSGTGRELGEWGIDAFCETKAIQLPPDAAAGPEGLLIRSSS